MVEKLGKIPCSAPPPFVPHFTICSRTEMSSKVKKRKAIDYYGISSVASKHSEPGWQRASKAKKKSRRENDKTSLLPVN